MSIFSIVGDIFEDFGKHIENTVDLLTGNKDLQDFVEDGLYIPLDRAQEWNDNWNPEEDVDKFISQFKIKQDYYPEVGDILGVERLGYIHWAIYAGDDEVIHYTKQVGCTPSIELTNIDDFQRLRFLGLDFKQSKIFALNADLLSRESMFLTSPNDSYKTYEIAKSKIGDEGYSLLLNNCGDFVFECKWGHKLTFEDQAKISKYRIYFDY